MLTIRACERYRRPKDRVRTRLADRLIRHLAVHGDPRVTGFGVSVALIEIQDIVKDLGLGRAATGQRVRKRGSVDSAKRVSPSHARGSYHLAAVTRNDKSQHKSNQQAAHDVMILFKFRSESRFDSAGMPLPVARLPKICPCEIDAQTRSGLPFSDGTRAEVLPQRRAPQAKRSRNQVVH